MDETNEIAEAQARAPVAAPQELSPADCAQRLAALFPALFGQDLPPRPVKLRIHADIQQRAPGQFSRRTLSMFLHRHTTTTAYLKALVAAPSRFDLDGAPAGDIAQEHRQAAQQELQRRRDIAKTRRAAEARAHIPRTPPGPEADAAVPEASRPPPGAQDEAATNGAVPRADSQRPPRPGAHPRRASFGSGPREPQAPRGAKPRAPLPRAGAAPRPPGQRADADAAATHAPDFADPARRERALLLRAWEASPLTKANFCALKRMTPAELDAQLELARQERGRPHAGAGA